MAELTVTQIFGPSATRNGNTITINAADFASVGLGGSNPTPSQIAAGWLLWFQANRQAAIDDPDAGISPSGFTSDKQAVRRGSSDQLVYPVTVNIYRLDPTSALDPDDVI